MVIRGPKTDSAASGTAAQSNTSASPSSATNDAQNRPSATQANTGAFPFGLGLPGMGNLNFANTNFLDMQQQLQQQVENRLKSIFAFSELNRL